MRERRAFNPHGLSLRKEQKEAEVFRQNWRKPAPLPARVGDRFGNNQTDSEIKALTIRLIRAGAIFLPRPAPLPRFGERPMPSILRRPPLGFPGSGENPRDSSPRVWGRGRGKRRFSNKINQLPACVEETITTSNNGQRPPSIAKTLKRRRGTSERGRAHRADKPR